MTNFKTNVVTSAAMCALLAACATRPLYPTDQGARPPAPPPPPAPVAVAPPPAPAPPSEEGAPRAMPTRPVQSAQLAPPPGAQAAPPRPAAPVDYPPPPRRARVRPAPPAMIAQKAPGSGAVKTEGEPAVVVKRGDTLMAISRRTHIDVHELAELNDLRRPYRLRPGTKIELPTKRYYRVEAGDTLFSIARRFGMEPDDLASFNKFEARKGVRSGEKIYLPADAKDKGVPKPIMVAAPRPDVRPEREEAEAGSRPYAAGPAYAPPAYTPPRTAAAAPPPTSSGPTATAPAYSPPPPVPPPAAPLRTPPAAQARAPSTAMAQAAPPSRTPPAAVPSAPMATAPVPTAPVRTAPPAGEGSPLDAEVAIAGRGVFAWPVRGELLQTFGPRGSTRNDGIDLGATQGDAVRAAAAGEVVYAGNAVQGFGNLVLIKHAAGWVTAYAHLDRIEVKMRQQVSQGQEIGVVGVTGGVDRPELHFEIRYAPTPADKARPIDPMLVLPVQ